MWYVNLYVGDKQAGGNAAFILTMWYVNTVLSIVIVKIEPLLY